MSVCLSVCLSVCVAKMVSFGSHQETKLHNYFTSFLSRLTASCHGSKKTEVGQSIQSRSALMQLVLCWKEHASCKNTAAACNISLTNFENFLNLS